MRIMARDRLLLLIGKTGKDNTILRKFFAKVPEEEQNALAKKILATVIEYAGVNWNPVLEGYPFLRGQAGERAEVAVMPPFAPKMVVEAPVMVEARSVVAKEEVVSAPLPVAATRVMKPVISRVRDFEEDDDEDDTIPIATGIRRFEK